MILVVRQRTPTRVGLEAALGCVSPRVKRALELSHERLAELGIPHVLIGGLAVGVHGYQYATQDVDWLVSEKTAFDRLVPIDPANDDGTIVHAFKPGVPIKVYGVRIEYVTTEGPPNVVTAMQEALAFSESSLDRVFVASEELLVWMKLKAGRPKDIVAITELLRSGQMDVEAVHDFLTAAGDPLVLKRFARCTEEAYAEE